MRLSVVIPVYNEATSIGSFVNYLRKFFTDEFKEIIVVDSYSTDETSKIALQAGATVVNSPLRGRSVQMNYGAAIATGDVLYFVHADCKPPSTFVNDISKALQQGSDIGRYRTRFDSKKIMLKLNAWFTRFDFFICMGGDQTLFVKRTLFEQHNGFREDMKIMEEYEFCKRVRQSAKYKILKGVALVSARKYETNSWLKVQLANSAIVRMYKEGKSQQAMLDRYKKLLKNH